MTTGSENRTVPPAPGIRYGTTAGRWVIAAAVLGSGMAFLDATVVNVALPAIRAELGMGTTGLQWTVDAYLVALSALVLLGGGLGDLYGRRRVFVAGLGGFVVASLLCGLAPTTGTLIAARFVQGAAAAFLVPGSLALISTSFAPEDRSRAVGAWSGLAGTASAAGPFLGGWLVDAVSWRLVFLLNLPLAAAALWVTLRHVPETRDPEAGTPDLAGAAAVTVGIAGVTYALIEGPARGGVMPLLAGVVGALALVTFVAIERRASSPMLPLDLFRSSQFTGANLTTFSIYFGLGGAIFLLVLHLQLSLGYSPLRAGASLLPFTLVMLGLSARMGYLTRRTGPRLPMTIGPVVAAAGLLLFGRVEPGSGYFEAVLPAVALFGLGMTITVAPLTSAVLAAVEERHVGVASGANNAVARLAGLLSVAVLPAATAIAPEDPATIAAGFPAAMVICATACAAGGVIAFLTIRTAVPVEPVTQATLQQPCQHPCLAESDAA
ncbi:MAG: MFS transporter [Actinomycetota bacterium]|nr:MFS transporter [Actinomycetota bacterium]